MKFKLLDSYYLLMELRTCNIRFGSLPIKVSFCVLGSILSKINPSFVMQYYPLILSVIKLLFKYNVHGHLWTKFALDRHLPGNSSLRAAL